MTPLLPLALKLEGLPVLVVGGGEVAETKVRALLECGARVSVVSPEIRFRIDHAGLSVACRSFRPSDLDGCWLAVSAATAEVNEEVAREARARRVFLVAVDDASRCTAHGAAVVRRSGLTLAVSTDGSAPALSALVREALEELLPKELEEWLARAKAQRILWRREGVPFGERRPLLLRTLNALYEAKK